MENAPGRKIYTVSELNTEIKTVLEDTYPDIWVEGEISGLKTYASGHTYFFLKDSNSQLSAVLFQGTGKYIKFSLEEGLKIIARGRVTAYPKRGDYQLIVNYAEPAGAGALQIAFEQLKNKLQNEGLFDNSRKRVIPQFVQKIGIITSPDGAALRDILSVIDRRYANVEILIYPVRVQGEEAKYEISGAIKYLNINFPRLDALLVGRGGGSYQDLWAFNEEIVARAIAGSKIPVISCVGHEIDYTIADLVADLRAPTPSAAAELVVKNKQDLLYNIDIIQKRLLRNMETALAAVEDRFARLAGAKVLERPEAMYDILTQNLDGLSDSLNSALKAYLQGKKQEFTRAADKLDLISPLNVLSRGYAICSSLRTRAVLKDSNKLNKGDAFKVTLRKGSFNAVVDKVFRAEKN